MDERYQKLKQTLANVNQDHLLTFYTELNEADKAQLLDQLGDQDWDMLSELIAAPASEEIPEDLQPAPSYPRTPTPDSEAKYAQARELGEGLISGGKVAAFTVAGGQGTRLGWDGPKGTFPATPLKKKPLFQVFAETLQNVQRSYDTTVPWYLMTSEINDADTRAFFETHDYFGLDKANVMFFKQGSMPSISNEGKVLLASKASLALSPDGHGGSLKALYKSGAIDDMERRGVEQISYFQVDNPNVKPIDPLFIGLHVLDEAEMSAKMLPKAQPLEKVGNFCMSGGRLTVIEYSDMPEGLAKQRDENGELMFNAGSIAIHLLSVAFVKRLNEASGRFALPYHRANKKVPYIDPDSGQQVTPKSPNAIKLETFVFDAMPLAKKAIILETERTEEFAPIKNAEGADSPATSGQLQTERAARWLAAHGVKIPRDSDGNVDAVIELNPLTAVAPEQLKAEDLPKGVERGGRLEL